MTAWRTILALLLVGLVGVPLLVPFYEAGKYGSLADFEGTGISLGRLVWNTAALVLGTLGFALPVGTVAAILLFRTDLPGRRLCQAATVFFLFVPLAVLLSGWQSFLGADSWLSFLAWRTTPLRWAQGLGPAIWIHGLASIPWVILIVGAGLARVERELEEEALLAVTAFRVLLRVTLPRCRASIAAAACWLAVWTFAESSVTYFLQLPTIAEEIHTRFNFRREALASSVLLISPLALLLGFVLLILIPRLEKGLPPLLGAGHAPRLFTLGTWRWPLALAVTLFAAPLLLSPLVGLLDNVGRGGPDSSWSASLACSRLTVAVQVSGGILIRTVFLNLATAIVCTLLGLVFCWQARESNRFRTLLVVFATLAWAWPAPVLGLGLKETINLLLPLGLAPLNDLLYYKPSPIPVVWVQILRFFPVALALTWPLVRSVPRELLEDARLHGGTPLQELLYVILPTLARGLLWVVIVLLALCLGEVSASSRVEMAGWETFPKILLDRMHYGADADVAALCLLQMGCLAVVGALGLVTVHARPLSTGTPGERGWGEGA